MSAPTFVKGFIPSPDVIRNSLGPIAANVFGVVWMYCQMAGKECYADVETIAANSGFGTTVVRTALKALVDDEWIERIERPGKTAVYRDVGRWAMRVVGEEFMQFAAPTLTRGVASADLPQRDTLPTPTPDGGGPQRHALTNIQKKQTTKQTIKPKSTATPPVGGGGDAPATPAPVLADDELESEAADGHLDDDAPVSGQRPTFGALCRAAKWSPRDLTAGNREQLGKLATRLLEEPEDDRPTPVELGLIYQAELMELSGRLRKQVKALTVPQFRQAIGAWVAAKRQATADGQAAARRQAEQAAEWRASRQAAESEPSNGAAAAWESIAAGLATHMAPASWQSWVKPATACDLSGGILTVEVDREQAADWLTARLGPVLDGLASDAGVTLAFTWPAAEAAAA